MRNAPLLSFALLSLLLGCTVADAQQEGSINGTVTDPSGGVVAGAHVVVTNDGHA